MRATLFLPVLLAVAAPAGAAPSYTVAQTVPLGAPDRWDLLSFEPESHRVFVSHGTEVTVIDAASGSVVGHVAGLSRAHGVAEVPALGKGYADSGDKDIVTVFDLRTLQPLRTVPTGSGPDDIAYDPATRRVFVMNGDGASVTAIDAATDRVAGTIKLGGQPEAAADDGKGKLFVNLESTKEIVRIDAASLALEARWPIAACEKPHGLAIDPAARRLFATCVNQVMLVVDAETGRVLASLPIGRGTDAAAFDPVRKLAFSSNGAGTLSVVTETDAEHFGAPVEVPTLPGARTMALDPASGRIFLVTADGDQPAGGGRFQPKPGTVKLVVLTPGG